MKNCFFLWISYLSFLIILSFVFHIFQKFVALFFALFLSSSVWIFRFCFPFHWWNVFFFKYSLWPSLSFSRPYFPNFSKYFFYFFTIFIKFFHSLQLKKINSSQLSFFHRLLPCNNLFFIFVYWIFSLGISFYSPYVSFVISFQFFQISFFLYFFLFILYKILYFVL